jgi:hypothetical protein
MLEKVHIMVWSVSVDMGNEECRSEVFNAFAGAVDRKAVMYSRSPLKTTIAPHSRTIKELKALPQDTLHYLVFKTLMTLKFSYNAVTRTPHI